MMVTNAARFGTEKALELRVKKCPTSENWVSATATRAETEIRI
jgi:hypothetical protein